jgi:hypothetical protein
MVNNQSNDCVTGCRKSHSGGIDRIARESDPYNYRQRFVHIHALLCIFMHFRALSCTHMRIPKSAGKKKDQKFPGRKAEPFSQASFLRA